MDSNLRRRVEAAEAVVGAADEPSPFELRVVALAPKLGQNPGELLKKLAPRRAYWAPRISNDGTVTWEDFCALSELR